MNNNVRNVSIEYLKEIIQEMNNVNDNNFDRNDDDYGKGYCVGYSAALSDFAGRLGIEIIEEDKENIE